MGLLSDIRIDLRHVYICGNLISIVEVVHRNLGTHQTLSLCVLLMKFIRLKLLISVCAVSELFRRAHALGSERGRVHAHCEALGQSWFWLVTETKIDVLVPTS
jgi:hypothetical protein